MQHYHLISSGLVSSPVYSPMHLSSFSLFSLLHIVYSFAISPSPSFSPPPSLSLFSPSSTSITFSSFSHPRRLFSRSPPYPAPSRDVHSILSHLLEVTQDHPSPHFPWAPALSFISNSRTDPPAPIARLILPDTFATVWK